MNHETEKKSSGFPFGTLIGVGTLIVTMIALIPAFLALNKEKPDVYYSYSRQDIKAPFFVDEAKFKTFLKDNNIVSFRQACVKNSNKMG